MNSRPAPAALAPTRPARRIVLGTALLIGLAIALGPRSPVVHAQAPKSATAEAPKPATAETPKPATAEAPKPPAASKTVTLTGRDGVAAKIEVRDEAGAGTAAADAAAETPDEKSADADKPGSKGHNVTFGRHGKVRVNGLGTDREFDSFNEFLHDEPAIAGMVVAIVAVVFLSPVLAIGLILWYRIRKTRMLNETMLKLAEKGVVAPADALEALAGGKQAAMLSTGASTAPIYEQARQIRRRAAWSDLRKGVITGGIGLALTLFSVFDDRSPNSVGLVLLFVGIGYVVLWWFEERQLAPANGTAAGSGTPGGPPAA